MNKTDQDIVGYPASVTFCYTLGVADFTGIGGNFRVESVAGLPWNEWQLCYGISGSFAMESVAAFVWNTQIYHVFLGKRRTTVSLDPAIAFFLELKLGEKPGTPGAKKTVRQWLQERLDKENDPGRLRVSQWLKRDTLLALVDPKLVKRYWEWVDGGMSDNG